MKLEFGPEINFFIYSFLFSVAFGFVTLTFQIAPSTGNLPGTMASGMFSVLATFSALFLGPLVTTTLNARQGTIIAIFGFAIAIGVFFTLMLTEIDNTVWKWVYAALYGIIAGISGGLFWTSWGVYMACTVGMLSGPHSNRTREQWSIFLSSVNGIIFLFCELMARIISYVTHSSERPFSKMSPAFGAVMFVCAVLMMFLNDVRNDGSKSIQNESIKKSHLVFNKLFKAVELWNDPRVWLFGLLNFAFGLSATIVNSFVNPMMIKAMGNDPPGSSKRFMVAMMAVTTASALVFVHFVALSDLCAKRRNAKRRQKAEPEMKDSSFRVLISVTLCSLCFLFIGLSVIVSYYQGKHPEFTQLDENGEPIDPPKLKYDGPLYHHLGSLSSLLPFLYVFQGLGRGIYESVNKAIWATHFADNLEGAFANQMMTCNLALALGFMLPMIESLRGLPMAWFSTIIAAAVVPGYLFAIRFRPKDPTEQDGSTNSEVKDKQKIDESDEDMRQTDSTVAELEVAVKAKVIEQL